MNDFSINLTDRDTYVYGVDDVIQCWDIILKTPKGKYSLMPEFGCDIHNYVDSPINDVFAAMVNAIIVDLERWETRAKVSRIERVINESQLIIGIYGTYTSTGESIITKIPVSDIIIKDNDGIGYMVIGQTLIVS